MSQNDLKHWGLAKGEKAKDHKYIARVEDGEGYRYFYSWSEYNNYLRNGKVETQRPGMPIRNPNTMTLYRPKTNTVSKPDIKPKTQTQTQTPNATKANDFISRFSSMIIKGSRFVDKNIIQAGREKIKEMSDVAVSEIKKQRRNITKTANNITKELQDHFTKSSLTNPSKKSPYEPKRDDTARSQYISRLKHAGTKILDTMSKNAQNIYNKAKSNTLNTLKKQKVKLSSEEDASLVNPYYDIANSNQYTNNCSHCTLAYDMRRRGYDVEAAPSNKGDGESIKTIASWYKNAKIVNADETLYNWLKNHQDQINNVKNADDKQLRKYLAKSYEEEFAKYGPGARGNLCVSWSTGGGHSIVWEVNKKGKVEIIDAQNNTRYNIEDYNWTDISAASYIRTDNLDLTEKAAKNVVSKENNYKNPKRNGKKPEINRNLSDDKNQKHADYYYDKNGNEVVYRYVDGVLYINENGKWRRSG